MSCFFLNLKKPKIHIIEHCVQLIAGLYVVCSCRVDANRSARLSTLKSQTLPTQTSCNASYADISSNLSDLRKTVRPRLSLLL